MKNIDYATEIKKSTKNIDFDESTKRIFEEFVDWLGKDNKNFLNIIKKFPADNFYNDTKDMDYAKFVTKMFAGIKNSGNFQSLYYSYEKKTKNAIFKSIVITGMGEEVVNSAIIENPYNYIKQLFNLAHAAGADFKIGYPKNERKYHILIETSFGQVIYLSEDKQNQGYFHTLLARYLSYNENLYDKRIKCSNKKEAIKHLIKNKFAKQLYAHLKEIYDNEDFIYAILTYLDSEEKIKLFLQMIEKNESYMCGMKMGTGILRYLSDAEYLYKKPLPKNISFLSDRIKNVKESEKYGELFKKLIPIYKDEEKIYYTLLEIRSKKDYDDIVNLIDSGLKDKNLIDAYCEVSRAKYVYTYEHQERGFLLLKDAIEDYQDNQYFQNIQEKIKKGEPL